jgi:prevent-host-death family protein
MTRIIKASEFKAKCLSLMDEVAQSGESLVITKNGKPVAELKPYGTEKKNLFGIWKDAVVVTGDIVSPIDVEWDAMK